MVIIQMRWGKLEILEFGNPKERWKPSKNSRCHVTAGLVLRLTENAAVVYVLCVSNDEYLAWLPGQINEEIYPSYTRAIYGAFGFSRGSKKDWEMIGNVSNVFTPILDHFIVGTSLTTKEKFHITAEGQRLRPAPLEKPVAEKRAKIHDVVNDDNDDGQDYDAGAVVSKLSQQLQKACICGTAFSPPCLCLFFYFDITIPDHNMEALVNIQTPWGSIEILAFGDPQIRWSMHDVEPYLYFATSGLHLRVSDRDSIVHVICLSKDQFKSWLCGQFEQSTVYSSFGDAIYGLVGHATTIATATVFCSLLNHFVVGTVLRTSVKNTFQISAMGERLRPFPRDSDEKMFVRLKLSRSNDNATDERNEVDQIPSTTDDRQIEHHHNQQNTKGEEAKLNEQT
jgi:hypothetical protein